MWAAGREIWPSEKISRLRCVVAGRLNGALVTCCSYVLGSTQGIPHAFRSISRPEGTNDGDATVGCQAVDPCMLATSIFFTIHVGKLSGTRPQFCTQVNSTAPKTSRDRCCQKSCEGSSLSNKITSELSWSPDGMPSSCSTFSIFLFETFLFRILNLARLVLIPRRDTFGNCGSHPLVTRSH